MADTQPGPAPIPAPDRHQIERLNQLYDLSVATPQTGVRGRLTDRLRRMLVKVLFRQQEFNAAVVDHLNRNTAVGIEAHEASARTLSWVDDRFRAVDRRLDRIEAALDAADDDRLRHREAFLAGQRRTDNAVAAIGESQEELRAAVGVVQQAAQNLKREITRLAATGVTASSPADAVPATPAAAPAGQFDALDSHKYVGFEDQFRGDPEDIRARVAEYLPIFDGASDVLDVGCGRGEFLTLLREHGIGARGIDINGAMIDLCRQQGLDASEADALAYLRAQPDGSLGGLFAAQVIEHLEPRYLVALLDAAFDKLRPGAPIVLETINPACWFAFFESYIRDITHVRPIHPETLKYLLVASGFQRVDLQYRAPYPEHEKLQPVSPAAALGDAVDTLNANVERLNSLLFTWLDYAAVGRHP